MHSKHTGITVMVFIILMDLILQLFIFMHQSLYPGPLRAGDTGDIAGLKCRNLTSDVFGSAVDVPGF